MRAFSVNPQQRTRRLPISEGAAFGTPSRSTLELSTACFVVKSGCIWAREQSTEVLAFLALCEKLER